MQHLAACTTADIMTHFWPPAVTCGTDVQVVRGSKLTSVDTECFQWSRYSTMNDRHIRRDAGHVTAPRAVMHTECLIDVTIGWLSDRFSDN